MDTVTYPNADVQQFIESHYVPIQFNISEHPDAMQHFHTPWTPTVMVQDAEGVEHHRSQGYLDARRFVGEMALANLMVAIDRQDFARARELVQEARRWTQGDAYREPQVFYWAAVVEYKATNDGQNLVNGWNELLDRFPESEWAKRAEFIRF